MATALGRTLAWLRVPANQVGFALRSRRRRRREVVLRSEAKDELFAHLEGDERLAAVRLEAVLASRYDLQPLAAQSTRAVYADNLALLANMERLCAGVTPAADASGVMRAVDVGSADFRYATALQRFFVHHAATAARTVDLLGVEIDGYGVYRDRHVRADHGRAHARLAGPGVRYQVGDFTRLELTPQHAITLLFPFLSFYPLLRWGSPVTHYRPARLLGRAAQALVPGGWLLVVNQTAAEFARLAALLRRLPLQLVQQTSFRSPLVPYAERTADRRGSLWRRLPS